MPAHAPYVNAEPTPELKQLVYQLTVATEICYAILNQHKTDRYKQDCWLCGHAEGVKYSLQTALECFGKITYEDEWYRLESDIQEQVIAELRRQGIDPWPSSGDEKGAEGEDDEADTAGSRAVLVASSMGATVRQLRHRQELTQEQLARAVGLSAEQVRQLEAGAWQPDLRTLVRMAGPLGVSDDDGLGADKPHVAERDGQERGHG
jgi:DNA-binding XRE family transcriptional regulator